MTPSKLLLRIACLAFATLLFSPSHAQVGGSFYADFELSGKGRQGQASSMTQDAEGNMLMATLGGVVVFDGSHTSLVGTGALSNVLEFVPDNQKTYAGCDGRIGYIKRNNFGKFTFTRIELPQMENQGFSVIAYAGKDVYFQSDDWVIKVTDDKVTGKWKRPDQGNYSGLFVIQNTVFVNISSSGLYTLQKDGKLKKVAIDDSKVAEEMIMFACPRANNEVLLGLTSNLVYMFNGTQLQEIPCDRVDYLKSAYLLDGKKLDNNKIVLATFFGGIMVMDMYNGRVLESFNTSSGFPDDQVYSIAIDKAQGIWVNHEVGFTRIDRNVPVKYFSAYPGLKTRVYSVAEANGALYAGCSDGLYRLKEVDNMGEYIQALENAKEAKKAQKESKNTGGDERQESASQADQGPVLQQSGPTSGEPSSSTTTTTDETAIDRAGKKIKKIWRRVKDQIPGTETPEGGSPDGAGGESNPKGEISPKGYNSVTWVPTITKNGLFSFATVGQEKNAQFIYSKVEGISSKVKKILVTPAGIVCVTTTGLYEYSNSGLRLIYTGEIKDAVYSAGKVAFITSQGPFIMSSDGTVTPITINPKHHNFVTLFLENGNTLWLGGTNVVLKASLSSAGAVTKEKIIEIPADFPDYMNICRIGNVVYFISGGGLFEYHAATESAKISSLNPTVNADVLDYVINMSATNLFLKTAEGWKEVKSANELVHVGLLDVLEDIRYIHKSNTGNLWAVGSRGDIFYLNRNSPAGGSFSGFGVFFRGVQGFDGKPFDLSNLSISYKDAAVEVRWGSNLYLLSKGTWYQYKIEGTGGNQWSQWTKETSLKIQLKPGKYTFVVRARDVMGNISPEQRLSFSINPPFWQTWWFYTIVALLLGAIVFFIFRWRNRALIENQKRLEKMVVERTRELGIEKEKTEELLLNILPKAVAQELKEMGHSSVRRHSDSAVMFTDFCNFTHLSKDITAEQLVEKLDGYFRKFDEIVDKYGLEKIKTIGDSYMCAAGVPQPRTRCSLAIVMAALEILDVVRKAESHWQIRVGIHKGGLVSGVVGKRKFAYDIWGDTVNVASRMESSSEPMHINITEQVYEEVKDYFDCVKRGEVEAKSLGKTNMYFVKGLKAEYRDNGNEIEPNKDFLTLLN